MAEETTLADDVAAAFEAHESKEPPQAEPPAEPPDSVEAPTPADEPEEKPAAQAKRTRDAQGRFVDEYKRPKEETKAEGPETPAEAAPEKPEPEKPEPPKAEVPSHWSAADREMFAKQSPEAQAWLMRRHGEMEKGFQEKSQELAAYRKAVEPFQGFFAQRGLAPQEAITRLLRVDHFLRSGTPAEKARVYADIGKAYGIAQNTPDPAHDPALEEQGYPEDEQLRAIKERQDRLESELTSRRRAEETARVQQRSNELREFIEAKSETGEPVHPHAEELIPEMIVLANGLKASGKPVPPLKELYETAAWASPAVRPKLQEAQRNAAAAAAEAEKKAHAEKAKQAQQKHPRGDVPVSKAPPASSGTVRDDVARAYEQASTSPSGRV